VINSLRVEKIGGGQAPPDQDIRVLAELIRSGEKGCCLFSAK
jgi:hypothetical protein